MNKYVISVSILLLSSSSLAQDSCMVRPSCADMGYTKSASDCEGKKAISCPFDTTLFYCPESGFSEYPLETCPDNGVCLELTQYKLDSCQNSYELSSDGLTCNACNFTNYPLSTCDANGTCSNYTCGNVTKYKLDSCKSGYTMSGNTCNPACDFGDYTLTTCPSKGTCSDYTCGGTTKYYLENCQSGYQMNSAQTKCTACSWGSYTLTKCPTNGSCTSKTCGGKTQYYLSSCKSGYLKSGNTCKSCSSVCIDESSCEYPGSPYRNDCNCATTCCDRYYNCQEYSCIDGVSKECVMTDGDFADRSGIFDCMESPIC